MKGFLLTMIIDDDICIFEFFKFIRLGISWSDDELQKATILIFGLWKLETHIALVYRKEIKWHDVGES